MKTIQQQITKISQFLEKNISSYIEKATGAFFPKQQTPDSLEDDDDEPTLFI